LLKRIRTKFEIGFTIVFEEDRYKNIFEYHSQSKCLNRGWVKNNFFYTMMILFYLFLVLITSNISANYDNYKIQSKMTQ